MIDKLGKTPLIIDREREKEKEKDVILDTDNLILGWDGICSNMQDFLIFLILIIW